MEWNSAWLDSNFYNTKNKDEIKQSLENTTNNIAIRHFSLSIALFQAHCSNNASMMIKSMVLQCIMGGLNQLPSILKNIR